MKTEISKYNPCIEAVEFRSKFNTFSDAWNNCPCADWMLWIALKLKVDVRILTTAKALCANTVRHLMKDDRSKNAIDAALLFGNGEATIKELNDAAYAGATAYAAYAGASDVPGASDAAYAAYAATYASGAAYAAAYVDTGAYAAAYAAAAAGAAADAAAYAAADAAAYAAAYAAARLENKLQTANICMNILTIEVFNKIK